MKKRACLSSSPLSACFTFDFVISNQLINEVAMKVFSTLGFSHYSSIARTAVVQNQSDVIVIDIAGV